MPVEARFDGDVEFLSKLAQADKDLSGLEDVERDGAGQVTRAARRLSPFDSGALRASGRVESDGQASFSVFGSGRVRHAAPTAFGSFNRPQGGSSPRTMFLFRGADQAEPDIAADAEAFVDDYIQSNF